MKEYVAEHKSYAPIGKILLSEMNTEWSAEIDKKKVQGFARRKLPVLLMWGDTDRILPIESMKLFKENLTNLRCEEIKDCGHAVMLDKPKVCCQAVYNFLTTVQADPLFLMEDRSRHEKSNRGSVHSNTEKEASVQKEKDDSPLLSAEKGGEVATDVV